MKFDVVTIFPSMIHAFLSEGVIARAAANGVLDVAVHDLRSFTTDRHRTVDDVPYGGGPGMLMKPAPLLRAVQHVRQVRGAPDASCPDVPAGHAADAHRSHSIESISTMSCCSVDVTVEWMTVFVNRL